MISRIFSRIFKEDLRQLYLDDCVECNDGRGKLPSFEEWKKIRKNRKKENKTDA